MADRGFREGRLRVSWVVKVALAEKGKRKRCWFHEDTRRRWFPKWETTLVSKEGEEKMLLVS